MRPSNYPDKEVTSINWQAFTLILPYLFEYKKRIAFALLCLVFTKIASVYLPFILKDIVDTLDKNQDSSLLIAPLALVAAYGLVRLSIVILAEIRDTLFGRVTERAIRRIGLKVFRHLHALDLDFHLNRQTGGLSRDIDRGTSGINFLMRFMVFNIVPTLLEIVMVVTILFVNYGVWFALITLTSIVLYIAYSVYATELRTRYVRAANKADSSSNTRAIDSLLNYETVKYFTNEEYESKAYDKQLATWEQAKIKNRLTLFALNGGQALIIAIAMTAMLALAAVEVSQGNMTLGDFVLINAFMMQLFMPLNFLGFVYREIKGSLANIENLFGLLGKIPKVQDAEDAADLVIDSAEIRFNNVHFSYHKKRPIINDISFTVKGGEKVAVVGESGSGKSTLLRLINGRMNPSKGKIMVDYQTPNISDKKFKPFMHKIGYIPQNLGLIKNSTVLENILIGALHRISGFDSFFKKFSDSEIDNAKKILKQVGLQGKAERKVYMLSGGEKRRVAIARALVQKPEIILADEIVSELDHVTAREIMDVLAEAQATMKLTAIMVHHDLQLALEYADRVAVIKEGEKVLEIGVEGGRIVDFQSGNYTQREILEMFTNESKE